MRIGIVFLAMALFVGCDVGLINPSAENHKKVKENTSDLIKYIAGEIFSDKTQTITEDVIPGSGGYSRSTQYNPDVVDSPRASRYSGAFIRVTTDDNDLFRKYDLIIIDEELRKIQKIEANIPKSSDNSSLRSLKSITYDILEGEKDEDAMTPWDYIFLLKPVKLQSYHASTSEENKITIEEYDELPSDWKDRLDDLSFQESHNIEKWLFKDVTQEEFFINTTDFNFKRILPNTQIPPVR